MDEKLTRRQIIDKRLNLAGWYVKNPSMVSEEFDIYLGGGEPGQTKDPRRDRYAEHQFADYLLLTKDGKPAAVVEAKRTSKDARVGQEQALQYAENIRKTLDCDLPFVFYTNGNNIFFWDSARYPPRKVHGFPSRDDLENLAFQRKEHAPLSRELINTDIAGRDYQIEALRSVLEQVEHGRRKFLMIMATGTGKTRTAVALIDVLMRARWVKRVAFLVDRIALCDQALEAFRQHLPNAPRWPERGEGEFKADRRVYCATYPTMLNLIQGEEYISPFFFDLIVADESHRSIYNTYQQVLNYFDAVQVGLTATPTDRIDHNTFDLFECDTGVPTFAYSYEEAIAHVPPYLNDFSVLNVRSKFQLEGIHGGKLPPEVQRKLLAEGKDPEDIDFEGTDLEKKVTNSGTNALILREFMEECIKDPNGVLPGKSIIFAMSKAHARRLQEIFDVMYPEHKGRLCRVIVSEDPRVHGKGGLLDQFKNQDMPRVAISVDMLDTGIDILEVVNLVFAKPVYSYTKFWQMIGRGTRVLDEDTSRRKPWCTEKIEFLIIDCWANFDFFKMKPRGKEPGIDIPLPVRLFEARLNKLEAALACKETDIAESTVAALRADLASLPDNNVVVLESREHLTEVAADNYWLNLTTQKLGYLRSQIAPVLRARSGGDFKAMRFEKDAVDLSTAHLAGNEQAYEAIKESVKEQVSELPLTVNLVAVEKEFIEAVLHEHWWTTVDDAAFDELTSRLAPLMKFRQKPRGPMETLHLDDLVAIKEKIEFGPAHERMSTTAYREKVEQHIRELVAANRVLQKIRDGEAVTDDEVAELAELLEGQDPYITEKLLQQIYDNKKAHFIEFIQHILGIRTLTTWTEEVRQSFDDFMGEHTNLTQLQIQFLLTLRTFILQAGKFEKKDLVEPPFTQLHPQGVRGIFEASSIEEILDFASKLLE
ncbi:MAG: DEAD/DEAH box helicase family protein [Verrucomicrobia bacterium]|nr:DEAD/DEAH box helicase family protein [Verrucomicrobiota bacterium]